MAERVAENQRNDLALTEKGAMLTHRPFAESQLVPSSEVTQ